jgi:OmpR-family two-component system manganese-sensing sensor histidine kinase
MFQATRRRLAVWYTAVTAVLLLLFAIGMYGYVRTTLVERVDDTLNHVVEIVQRSLVIEPGADGGRVLTAVGVVQPPVRVNVEASFRDNAQSVEDDRIDLEWFSPSGQRLWSTFAKPPQIPLHVNPKGETVYVEQDQLLRQITQRIQRDHEVLGYLRVSHPWFEVTKPSRQLIWDLGLGLTLGVTAVGAIGWLLSGLAIAPVRDSYQQLKQFTADASHELRNPIAVIQTNVQVALADPEPDGPFQQGQLQVIERLTRRLGRLVDDLLFLARQESGLVPLQRQALDLHCLLEDVTEEQQAIAQERGIDLTYVFRDQPGADQGTPLSESASTPILADGDQLSRLFTNLVGNALTYTAKGQVTVTLGLSRHQGQPSYLVQVQDTGVGIDPALLPHVFDRFYRADPARQSRDTAGSGLGLAIAKVITENHRGTIRLDSQPGQGTCVSVLLPKPS